MTAYKGFAINTSVTPKPWGATEEQYVKDHIDTTVKDTIAGASDPVNGHRHARVYDPAGNALIEAASTGLILESESTGSVKLELIVSSGEAILSSSTSQIDVDANNVTIHAFHDVVLDNFNQEQYLYTDTSGTVHQGPLGVDASHNNALMPNGAALQFTKDTSYIMGNTNGDILMSTSNSDITIHSDGVSSGDIDITNNYYDINIDAYSSGQIYVQGSYITLTAGNTIIIPTIPTSSAGLTTGMLWASSGGAIMRIA